MKEDALVAKRVPRPDFDAQWREFLAYMRESALEDPRAMLATLIFNHRWRITHWTLDIVNFTMEVMMARGKKPAVAGKDTGNGYSTVFVEIPVGDTKDADIARFFGSSDGLSEHVEDVIRSGYRIGVTYNAQNDAVIASLTCRETTDPNAGCTLTAFAGDWVTAIQVVLYKHLVIASKNWRGSEVQTVRPRFG